MKLYSPWVKYKTYEGKKLCQFLILNDFYFPVLDCDKIFLDLKISISDSGEILTDFRIIKNYIECMDDFDRFIKYTPGMEWTDKKIMTGKKGRPKNATLNSTGLKTRYEVVNEAKRIKNAENFPETITKNCEIENSNYLELYAETLTSIKEKFYCDNPERIKKHPYNWFKHLLVLIKQNTPKPDINNIDLLYKLWDIYRALCYEVSINTTIENFGIMVGLSGNDLHNMREGRLSPAHLVFYKKMFNDSKADMTAFLSVAPGSNINQMFIAKSIYGIRDDTVIHHITTREDTKTIADIPLLSDILPAASDKS